MSQKLAGKLGTKSKWPGILPWYVIGVGNKYAARNKDTGYESELFDTYDAAERCCKTLKAASDNE